MTMHQDDEIKSKHFKDHQMEPLVSVIMPSYNCADFIGITLDSVIAQTYKNWEVIVVDDCSTDRSREMVAKVNDKRIKIMTLEPNQGYSKAKNEGIIHSKGEYITTIDSDDMLTLPSISKRVRYLDEHPETEVVHGIAYKFEGSKSYAVCLRKQHKLAFDRRCKIHAQGIMYRRETFRRYGLFYEALRSKADKEYNTRLQLAGAKIDKIMTKCAFYRIHGKSMLAMRNRDKKYDKMVTKKYYERLGQIKMEGTTRDNTRFPPCEF